MLIIDVFYAKRHASKEFPPKSEKQRKNNCCSSSREPDADTIK